MISNEDEIIKALEAATPAEIVNSEKLLHSFRSFFSKGSVQDFSQLLPVLRTRQSISPTQESLQKSSDLNTQFCQSTASCSPRRQTPDSQQYLNSSEPASVPCSDSEPDPRDRYDEETNEMWDFFAARVKPRPRIQYLIRVVYGSLKAVQYPQIFYENLWETDHDNIFGAEETTDSRLTRLYRGRKRLDRHHQKYECASRLSLVFLGHEIEVTKSLDWNLSPGQSRQHAAVISIAHHLGVAPEEIKKEWRRSRNYIMLAEMTGPGSLLEIGSGVNWHWEKAMSKIDVTHFIDFRKERLPHLDKRAQELNMLAGRLIIDGMLSYGWTLDTIFKTSTRLRNALVSHCPSLFNSLHAEMQMESLAPSHYNGIPTKFSPSGNSTTFNESLASSNHSLETMQNTTPLSVNNVNGGYNFGGTHEDLLSNMCFTNDQDFATLMRSSGGKEFSEDFPLFPSNMNGFANEGLSWHY